jgi:hypothetical protein
VIAGVDSSSFAVDIVLLDDDTDTVHSFHHIVLPGKTPFERARGCRQRLPARSWWEDNGVWLLGFEDPFSHDAHVAKALGLIAGAFAAQLPPDLTAVPTPPSEWQRRFTGWEKQPRYSIERKQLIREAAIRRGFNGDGRTQDLYDAFGIACVVRDLNNRAIREGRAA